MVELHKSNFVKDVVKPIISLLKWTFILFTIFVCSSFFVHALTGFEYLTTNTKAYWGLNDDNLSSHNALYNMTNGLTTNSTGFINTSRAISTNAKYLNISTAIIDNQPFTICGWSNNNQSTTGKGWFFIRNATSKSEYIFDYQPSGFRWYRTKRGVSSDCTTGNGTMTTNVWFMWCVGYNGTTMILWINDTKKVDCASVGVGTSATTNFVEVNGGDETQQNLMTGFIDEVMWFNKTLSQAEITFLFSNGVPNNTAIVYPFTNNDTPIYFYNQSPSDINTNNAVNGINITYTFNDTNFNISSPFLNWSIINSTGATIYSYVNGTQQSDTNRLNYTNNSDLYYRFFTDDIIYPATYNVPHYTMSNTFHYNYTLSNPNQIYKVELFNVSAKQYNILEVYLNSDVSSTILPVYYCNSSYISGNPNSDNNCGIISNTNFITCNHYHNYSCHNVLSMKINSGKLNNITITDTSYFLIKGANVGNGYIGYINGTIRSNATCYSNNNGNSYNCNQNVIDLHVHYYSNDTFIYKPCYLNTTGTLFCGNARSDIFNITILPPSSFNVFINQSDLYFNDKLNIIRNNATGFTTNITYYNWYVYDSNLTLYDTIVLQSNLTTQNYTLNNISNGYYYIIIVANDTNNQTSIGISGVFYVHAQYINPCNTSYTLNSTGVIIWFNYTNSTLRTINQTLLGTKGIINYTITKNNGNITFYNNMSGTYNLFLNEYYSDDTGCYINLCVSNYRKDNNGCVNNQRLISYTDINNCNIYGYDLPIDNNGYDDCVLPANTDKGLWFIILLFVFYITLLMISLRFPIATIGTLFVSIFLFIQMSAYFSDYSVIAMLLFPVISVIFGGLGLLLRNT